MGSVLIANIGRMISGELESPVLEADSLYMKTGSSRRSAPAKKTPTW